MVFVISFQSGSTKIEDLLTSTSVCRLQDGEVSRLSFDVQVLALFLDEFSKELEVAGPSDVINRSVCTEKELLWGAMWSVQVVCLPSVGATEGLEKFGNSSSSSIAVDSSKGEPEVSSFLMIATFHLVWQDVDAFEKFVTFSSSKCIPMWLAADRKIMGPCSPGSRLPRASVVYGRGAWSPIVILFSRSCSSASISFVEAAVFLYVGLQLVVCTIDLIPTLCMRARVVDMLVAVLF